jgi:ribosome biogenesis GTPase / thiamine phosphate phosphatase
VILENIGWNSFFAGQHSAGIPARVASVFYERFLVWTETGEIDVGVSGTLRRTSPIWPTVGDWVILREDAAVIVKVLERKTKLCRKQPDREIREQVLAANIDVLFIVSGLDRDYNERRLERYLVVAKQSGARPVVLLNKSDLADGMGMDIAEVVKKTQQMDLEIPVVALSALWDDALDVIPTFLSTGETAALLGSSGVGKSTILNRLIGDARQVTQATRANDNRGRHTTTSREMFQMPGGWLLIDMPGLREVQLWASQEHLKDSFDDIQELAQGCKFRDCMHANEPGCAVRDAGLDAGRLENYLKMQRELAFVVRKTDGKAARETKAKWKAIEKAMRQSGTEKKE